MDGVEAVVEGCGRVGGVAVAAEAGTEEVAGCDGGPAIVHVDLQMLWNGNISFPGEDDGFFDRVDHPELRDCYHE